MASAPFAIEGDDPNISPDPLLSPDVLTGASNIPAFSDPLGDLGLTPPISPSPDGTFVPQGPGLNQPGFQYQGPALDPQTGVSSYGTPAGGTATPGNSPLDEALGLGKLGLGIFSSVYSSRTGTVPNQTKQSTPIQKAKVNAGTSTGLMWFAILIFFGLVFWLEFKSGH